MSLKSELRFVDGIAVIDLKGRLSFGGDGERLRDLLLGVTEKGYLRILLNLSGLTHTDSGGLGDLVAAYTAITHRGGTIKLAAPPPKIQNMLHMTRIDSLFEICADEATAIASFPPASA